MRWLVIVILAVLWLSICTGLSSQVPEWQWAHRAGSGAFDGICSMAIDAAGNNYICGGISGDADFGTNNVTGFADIYGNANNFIAKLDADGNWLWARGFQTEGQGIGYGCYAVAGDFGNVYIAINFTGNMTINGVTYYDDDQITTWVARLDSLGNPHWVRTSVGTQTRAVTIDAHGNTFLTGNAQSNMTFGAITLQVTGCADAFAAKLDSFGNWLWASKCGGTDPQFDIIFPQSIAADDLGNAYLTGHFRGSVNLGELTINTLNGVDDHDIFVARLDENGNWIWAATAGGAQVDIGNSIILDGAGNSYVTGDFYGEADFGDMFVSSHGEADIFLAQLSPSGVWNWVRETGGPFGDGGNSLVRDASGCLYVTGEFKSNVDFGTTTLSCNWADSTSDMNADIFAAKADAQVNWLWAIRAGGTNLDTGFHITLDNMGNIYIAGTYWFNCLFQDFGLISRGGSDIFVAKISLETDNSDLVNLANPNQLYSNYPNPFRAETTLSFNLSKGGGTQLKIYNLKGQLVKSLIAEQLPKGNHVTAWTGMDSAGNLCPAGVYLYNLSTPQGTLTRKMILLK